MTDQRVSTGTKVAGLCLGLVATAAWAMPPLEAPKIFAPGCVSGIGNAGSPTFTPDGNTLFFTRSGATWGAILESRRVGDHWSEPQIAPFSGEWSDSQPAVSPDGSFLVFSSWRPVGDSKPTGGAASLWRVNKVGSGWSKAARLPDAVNISPRMFKPSVAADGSIYFMSIDDKGKKSLYRSQSQQGVYQKAEHLPFSTASAEDVDPEVAADESFLVFSSNGRRSTDDAHEHLFIVFKKNGSWGAVQAVRYAGDDTYGPVDDNEAHLSPDRRTLYFSSNRSQPVRFPRTRQQAEQDLKRLQAWDNGNNNAWFVPLGPLIDGMKT